MPKPGLKRQVRHLSEQVKTQRSEIHMLRAIVGALEQAYREVDEEEIRLTEEDISQVYFITLTKTESHKVYALKTTHIATPQVNISHEHHTTPL